MAFVTIDSECQTDNIVSSLLPIIFQFSEGSGDTVNVVAQVWYWNSAAWVKWGGQIRCANKYGYSSTYELDVSDLVAGLPPGDIWDLQGLGLGDGCFGGGYTSISERLWEYYSDWKIRVKVQREYKDVSSGLIVLDPDITTSNQFYVHQGAAPLQSAPQGIRNPGDTSLMAYNHRQINGSVDYYDQMGWLYMTDCPYQYRWKSVGSGTPEQVNQYDVTISKNEQHYISFINGEVDGANPDNEMIIETYGGPGGAGPHGLLNTHTHNYFFPPQNDGYISIDVGWRTLLVALTPNGAEGTNFSNVAWYYVYNKVSDSTGVLSLKSAQWKFTIRQDCNGVGVRRAYRRFAWKNKIGAYDFFTVDGLLKHKKKTKQKLFEKRNPNQAYYDYGQTYYQTSVIDVYTSESQELPLLQAEYLACIGESTETYVRKDLFNQSSQWETYDVNFATWSTWDMREAWRDNSRCNDYIGILIISKSIVVSKTSEGMAKVKFDWTYANREILPRR